MVASALAANTYVTSINLHQCSGVDLNPYNMHGYRYIPNLYKQPNIPLITAPPSIFGKMLEGTRQRTLFSGPLNPPPPPPPPAGYDAKACPIAWGKFNSKKQSFGQVHGLIQKPEQASQYPIQKLDRDYRCYYCKTLPFTVRLSF